MTRGAARGQRELRDEHELAIARALAAHLAREGIELVDLEKGDEAIGEPDVVGTVGGDRHGVEIIDAWYSRHDARGAWELVRKLEWTGEAGSAAGAGFTEEDLGSGHADPFVAAIQRALDDHGLKQYGIPTWLVLNASGPIAPLHAIADGPRLVGALAVPAHFAYLSAFLFLSPNGRGDARFFPVPSRTAAQM